MARRMYSIDQIGGGHDMTLVAGNGINVSSSASSATISLSLYQHNISIFSLDGSVNAYMTVYSVNSAAVTNKQELVDNLLVSNMPATGTAETHTKFIYAINTQGELLYTDLQGNPNMYSGDYTVTDEVVSIGG